MDGEVLKVKKRRRRFHSEDVTVFDTVIYAGRKTKQDMVKMNSMRVFASVAMAMGVYAVMAAEKTVVSSPDGKNEIRLYANPLTYEVVREGVTVVAKSEIGLTVDGARLGGEDATGCVPPVVKRETQSGVADAPRRGRCEGGRAEVRPRNAEGQGRGEDSASHGPRRRIRRPVQPNVSINTNS